MPELALMGDFNLSNIDWSIPRSLNEYVNYTLLKDLVQDNLVQDNLIKLVDTPTKERNILDLVLTTLSDIVNNFFCERTFFQTL